LSSGTIYLYGPLMLNLTLIAILLLGMKLSGVHVQEGTLMGTAFAVCFSYWFSASFFFYFLGYIYSSPLTLLRVFSIQGYSLFGVCLSLLGHCFFAGTIIDHSIVLIAGGLTSLSLGVLMFGNTPNRRNGAIVGILASATHFIFLLYLKIYYASFYIVVLNAIKRQ